MRHGKKSLHFRVDTVENGYVIHDHPGDDHRGRESVKHVAETKDRLKTVLMELAARDVDDIIASLPKQGA